MKTENNKVTVIGLGSMGITLARLLLQKGYQVRVWNRTPEKAAELVKEGAILTRDIAEAITASPVIVICVYNHEATQNILRTKTVETLLDGKLLLQLSTISPKEAIESESWAAEHGASYINGGIQAAPTQMGQPDTPILISGKERTYLAVEPVLKVFGGAISYLGEKIAASPTVDLATLSYIYGASIGFFHGARIIESQGISVADYANIVAGISPSFGAFLKHEGHMIHTENYAITESPLRISVEATARLEQTALEAGINSEFPAFAAALFKKAHVAGYGDQEVAAIIKVLREQ
ncbi:NAD(P)-dependent oxidoreductase [Pedobacter caeni]|uniref:3-hydroxyisobutyrate dehydrogenase n=1 Tax=Pedobacter caeni TaxID=288992 RepID=A0A1M5HTJ8_9SPHI|nr:NAD(P)-binding domain-containing protein [Pedobacter caeni]SHG19286.1 3-hydroxyisobutyrate dehydrogenase [Pedobacter caeni]